MANETKAPTAKHTSGPWRIIGDHQDNRDVFADNELLATAYDMDTAEPKLVAEANARLIAAAPELLDVMRDVAALLPASARLHPRDLHALQTRVCAALAKAGV